MARRADKDPERTRKIVELAEDGMTQKKIAAHLGISRSYVQRICYTNGLKGWVIGQPNTPQTAPHRLMLQGDSEGAAFSVMIYDWGLKLLFVSREKQARIVELLQRHGGEVI